MPASPDLAPFTRGSTLRHVLTMTGTGAVGLMAIFLVDFLSLFYVSLLRDDRLTAGVGYATTILFVAISVNIGSMIAGSAMVARRRGALDEEGARRIASTSLVLAILVGVAVSGGLLAAMPWMLPKLGATGVPLEVAERFLWITLPANALMAVGMALSGFLRAVGDPRRAMNVTLFGGLVTAVADPFFIFALKLGTDGAALATVVSRLVFMAVGLHGIVMVHRLLRRPTFGEIRADAKPFFDIALPAILTNVATPVAALFVYRILAPFGAEAIAASTIIDRLTPLAFGVLFALSGAVGPILAQNLGARQYGRLRQALRDALLFALVYCLLAWTILFLSRHAIAGMFGVSGLTAQYVAFFCAISGLAWLFNGFLFVANAAFNNLGFPLYSTAFNWGRATAGTIPVAWLGAHFGGVEGAMIGVALGSIAFGMAGLVTAFRAIARIEAQGRAPDER
ncbi:MAG: polysaccharide biosynthesis C-terminal domain-containing protein [Methylobacterium sp.]|nr:polysaccharide biosynthesis C-terminal domain-containing protein [Methylobacterium sp.]